MADREKIKFTPSSSYSNSRRSKIQKTTRGYVTKLVPDREKQYQTRRVKLVECDRKKALMDSIKPSKAENKFNFLYWVVSIVLVLILGSFAISGYINSKITENQTEDIITHTYQKQIGTEVVGGDFNFLLTNNDLNQLKNMKIYLKKNLTEEYLNSFVNPIVWGNSGDVISFSSYSPCVEIYDDNNILLSSKSSYSLAFTNRYSNTFIPDSTYYGYYYRGDSYYGYVDTTFNYFICNSYTNISTFLSIDLVVYFLNFFFYNDTAFETPIYETITYTYKVKDINYDWQNKFSQLGHLKNIFNGNDKFYDASYNYYSSMRSLTLTSTNDSDYVQNEIDKFYLTDEKVKLLYDYGILSFASKTKKIISGGNPFKTEHCFYIVLDNDIVIGDENISSSINYVNENYITSFNIDYYLNVKPSDFSLLSIFVFPIQVIYRIMYNFGVIVNFIISW